jgi:hypothetical protein
MDTSRKYLGSLVCIAGFCTLIVLLLALNWSFNPDEFEHVHSAWYIENGYRPYVDFFQHHHPLLWYVLIPFLVVFGHCTKTMMAIRIFMFVLTLAIAFCAYLITSRAARCREAGLLAVAALLPTVVFARTAVTLRPDVPMVLFGLVSVCFVISFLQTGRNRYMAYAGLSAFVSFMFLQKSVFLLIAYAILFLHQLIRKRISFKSVMCFCLCFALPFGAYLAYLASSGAIGDYFLTNWLLNAARSPSGNGFPPWGDPELAKGSGLFWVLGGISLGYALLRRQAAGEVKIIAFITIVLLLSLFTYNGPWLHYFLFPIVLLSVLIGCFLKAAFDKLKAPALFRVALAVAIIRSPLEYMIVMCENQTQHHLQKVDYVLRNSSEDDFVYDGANTFNLYRRDVHYFWFYLGPGRGLDTYNRLTGNRHGDYDVCELIRSKKPKFISDYDVDIGGSGLAELYRKTRFDGLYIRKAERQQQ